jgi:hypothetical protein
MKTKWFAILGFAAVSVLGAKSYDITFDQPAKVGNVSLAAGHYSVKVDGNMIHFKNMETGKTADVAGKMGTAAQKYDTTSSTSNAENGVLKVKEIALGGTTTKVEFENVPE